MLAALIQAAIAWTLLHGLATGWAPRQVTDALTSIAFAPPPHAQPSPPPRPHPTIRPAAPDPAGAPGRKPLPRAVAAPMPRIAIAEPIVAQVAEAANADRADRAAASAQGAGSGAAGVGSGSGGGGSGAGQGGASGPVKLSGDINAARDYPAATRDLRLGDHVILALVIDTAGAVADCRVVRASRDAAADAITCRLARERFRFRAARDAHGRPVRSTFGWKQRWFRPGGG